MGSKLSTRFLQMCAEPVLVKWCEQGPHRSPRPVVNDLLVPNQAILSSALATSAAAKNGAILIDRGDGAFGSVPLPDHTVPHAELPDGLLVRSR